MVDLGSLRADLGAEGRALDERVASIPGADWERPTPAAGWAVRDQVSHLAFFDRRAILALSDPDAFVDRLRADSDALAAGPDATTPDLELGRSVPPAQLLATWRDGRHALDEALGGAEPGARVRWYGPAMSLASFATARLMETWAHGTDVADALGLPPVDTPRLRHVIHLGVAARPYAFAVHGLTDPLTPVAVRATGPGGERWTWGDDDAPEWIEGPALDLALVFTQRRHPADTAVEASGEAAGSWLAVAQAFAGPAGPGRPADGGGRGR